MHTTLYYILGIIYFLLHIIDVHIVLYIIYNIFTLYIIYVHTMLYSYIL